MPKLLDKPVRWLADILWEDVVGANAELCARKNALHKPASGFAKVEAAWRDASQKAQTFLDLVVFLLRCHRTAPFCFYNGNTFSAVARDLIADLPLPAEQATRVRSATGHAIAGVLPLNELEAILEGIDLPDSWEFPSE